jgi:hypothetical protein
MQQLQERLDAVKVRICSLQDVGRELLWVLGKCWDVRLVWCCLQQQH